jgi:hypothetical protein
VAATGGGMGGASQGRGLAAREPTPVRSAARQVQVPPREGGAAAAQVGVVAVVGVGATGGW